jgi:hypothetical protein
MTTGPFFPNLIAGGTILPRRLVKHDATSDNACIATAAATDRSIGITDGRTRAHDSANHAESGDTVHLQDGRHVLELEAGTGGVTRGDQITAEAAGKGITSAGATDFVVGIALQSATVGSIFNLFWLPHQKAAS